MIDEDVCPRFKQLEADITKSEEWTTMFETKMGKDLLQPKLYNWLTEKTGEDLDLMKMSDVATYVNIAHYHDMKLTFDVDEEHYKWTRASSDQFVYQWFAAS